MPDTIPPRCVGLAASDPSGLFEAREGARSPPACLSSTASLWPNAKVAISADRSTKELPNTVTQPSPDGCRLPHATSLFHYASPTHSEGMMRHGFKIPTPCMACHREIPLQAENFALKGPQFSGYFDKGRSDSVRAKKRFSRRGRVFWIGHSGRKADSRNMQGSGPAGKLR